MGEFADISEFKSLNALFTRRLLREREFDTSNESFISPSDGVIFENGRSSDFSAFSIKGHSYSIKELLFTSIDDDFEKYSNDLVYANIYLSPKDYHHYHAPCDLQVLSAYYVPAKLYSVAKKYLMRVPNLYAKNERVILKCKMSNGGMLWLVFVGALNVGKMKFDFDPRIQTNAKEITKISVYNYENINFKKGEHIGNFELGSTIVIIAEEKSLKFEISSDQEIKFAQKIATII